MALSIDSLGQLLAGLLGLLRLAPLNEQVEDEISAELHALLIPSAASANRALGAPGGNFHLAALREMARVSRGRVRVYPLVDQAGRPLPDLLEHLDAQLGADGIAPRLVDVGYEFQRGATVMLELLPPSSRPAHP